MIFVTGATGLVGGRLVRRLVERSEAVRCLVLPGDPADPSRELPVEVVRGDVTELESLLPHGEGVSAIVHAAALMLPNPPEPILRVNVEGTANVIRFAKQHRVRRLVYLSAVSAVYAEKNVYGESKVQAEKLVRESGLDFTVLRLTMVYGPDGGHHFQTLVSLGRIPAFYPVIGSGQARLQPVWIEDVTQAIELALKEPCSIGKTYNASGATVVTFNQLVDAILARTGRRRLRVHAPFGLCLAAARALAPLLGSTPFSPAAVLGVNQDATLDNTPFQRECGYRPLPLEEGLKRALPA
jgi:nucleoside-diphosphate-sugar epimerase